MFLQRIWRKMFENLHFSASEKIWHAKKVFFFNQKSKKEEIIFFNNLVHITFKIKILIKFLMKFRRKFLTQIIKMKLNKNIKAIHFHSI